MNAYVLIAAALLFNATQSYAEEVETLDPGTLEYILNQEISVASARPSIPSEAPAVVTVISREEIEQSGARGLIDVLRTVPGFDFGVDIWGVVGLGFRGIWGQEGKIKLTVDGLPFNELMYGNVPFGNHFSVENFERIEIIRGPGSTMYGNFAEIAVINIVTQVGAEIPGVKIASTTGFYDQGFASQNVAARYGKELGNDGYFGFAMSGGMTQRSARQYRDPGGATWNMDDDSELDSKNIELNYRYGGLHANFIYDHYKINYRDDYGLILPDTASVRFISYNGQISYNARISNNLTVEPSFSFLVQQPWRNTDVPKNSPTYYDPTAYQYRFGLKADWDLNSHISTIVGGSYDWQIAHYGDNDPARYYLFAEGSSKTSFNRYAIYNEWILNTDLINITAGIRVEKNSGYNYSYAPRISLTKTFDRVGLKLIYNHAYRAPAIEQLADSKKIGEKLKDETSDNYEAELSYKISSKQNITANVFYIRMKNSIVYCYDEARNMDNYTNEGPAGTVGTEFQYRLVDTWGHVTAGYSYYRPTERQVHYYTIPGNKDMFLAFPNHKLTVDAGYNITSHLHINSTLIFNSEKYGFDSYDERTGAPVFKKHKPELVANLYLLYKDAFYKGLDVGIGIYDIFAANHSYLQPYNGGHSALPGPGREYFFRVSYSPSI